MTRTLALPPALSKEIRALFPLWGTTVAAVAAGFAWRKADMLDLRLFAYVAGSIAIGAQSIGQEYSYRTLPTLLSQPDDRSRLYGRKFLVSTAMLLALAVLALAASAHQPHRAVWPLSVVVWPPLCGLFLAPLMTMTCRSTLAGMILSGSLPPFVWIVTLAIARLGFGINVDAAGPLILGGLTLVMIVLCPLAGVLGWRRFATIEAIEVATPSLQLPAWLTRSHGARRRSPFNALVVKELHLQQMAFVVAGFYVVGWMSLVLLQRYIPALETFPVGAMVLLYSVGLTMTIGALASAEERHHGTLDWQVLQPIPAWQQWIVKLAVTFGLALLFGVAQPVLMIRMTPHEGLRTIHLPANLTVLVVLVTAGSVYISSLANSGVRAIVMSLPIGLAITYFVQMVTSAFRWVMLKLAGPLIADIVAGRIATSSMQLSDAIAFLGRAFLLTLAPFVLWLAFFNHGSSERSAGRIVRQAAAIAILITAGIILTGGVLASYELRPH